MNRTETGFEGLVILSPQVFEDERGLFYESWREVDYKSLGIHESFVQDNISCSNKNVLRGLHYQNRQGQLVTVIEGEIFDVVVDLRPSSKTYKQYFSITLDANNPQQLYMPPGFAHGFCVLSDKAIFHYKCTQYYDPKHESGIIWNDPDLNINWPLDVSFTQSARDQAFPSFRDWELQESE
jgi:dTDP-4-dehydrorhamnose 3,5-epimerase